MNAAIRSRDSDAMTGGIKLDSCGLKLAMTGRCDSRLR
jgi:hypothetical protein